MATVDPLSVTEIPEANADAWAIRQRHFDDTIRFYGPSLKEYETSEFAVDGDDFVSMSVTGSSCSLGCEHCGGAILDSMVPIRDEAHLADLSTSLAAREGEGVLLSGGCDPEGRVPLEEYLDGIRAAADAGLDVALHTGVVDDPDVVAGYAEAGAEAAMIDVIGDADTISGVYHLDHEPGDYDRALSILADSDLDAIPHVVVGLDHGEIRGEYRALEMIADHDVHALVLVILMPLGNAPMTDVDPPAPEAVGEVFARARELLPETTVMLGCARPANREYALDVETRAIRNGFNGVAFPSDGVVGYAEELGLDPVLENRCCSM